MRHFEKYCKDYIKIENYTSALKDNFKGWVCHHRLELTINGEYAHNVKELIRLGMYYNRPPYELIFMRVTEHRKLHTKSMAISEKVKEFRNNMPKTRGKPYSSFGKAYKEHYGLTQADDYNQYSREYNFWKRNGVYRWEL